MKNTSITKNYIIYISIVIIICQGCALNFDTGGSGFGIIEKSGELVENEVWDGRIYIKNDVIVPEGITLTIRAGTIIGFEPLEEPVAIIVEGELYAEGAPDRMIVFGSLGKQQPVSNPETAPNITLSKAIEKEFGKQNNGIPTDSSTKGMKTDPPQTGDWEGIIIESQSPNSRITYSRIQHAKRGIACSTDTVQIERCLFSGNNIGVLVESSNPTISANEFNRNGSGVQFRGTSAAEVINNEFTANRFGLVCEDDTRPRINLNNIQSNYEYAIICYSTSSPEIISNNITLNIGWAVYDGGRLSNNYISGNKQVGPNVTELSISTQSDQFYSVDEVIDPRSTPVAEAGLPRDNF